jgi:hypothetical protein
MRSRLIRAACAFSLCALFRIGAAEACSCVCPDRPGFLAAVRNAATVLVIDTSRVDDEPRGWTNVAVKQVLRGREIRNTITCGR